MPHHGNRTMSDQDYIRKAVELADGWRWAGDTWYGPMLICDTRIDTLLEDKWRFLLDALAAQLVRQVDALECLYISTGHDAAHVIKISGCTHIGLKSVHGPDRTMNTLKAIVDSKVLDRNTCK